MTVFVFCDPPDLFFFFFCTSYFDAPFIRARIHSSFKPALKSFYFFVVLPKACANSGAGIIHMATGMHLGVTPQAVHHPPSYLCVPESFPSMQLESEIPCQLVASFLWPFLVPSLSLYVEQHFFFIFFSPKITLLQLFFSSSLFPNF